MEAIIDKIVAKFKREAREFFEGDRKDIEAAEAFFVPRLSAMVTELLSGLYEEADEALLADRAGRRQSGLTPLFTNASLDKATELLTTELCA